MDVPFFYKSLKISLLQTKSIIYSTGELPIIEQSQGVDTPDSK